MELKPTSSDDPGPTAGPEPAPAAPEAAPEGARDDLRGLRRLRDRVETAAREIERLRAENAALAGRVAAMEGGDGADLPLDLAAPGAAAALRTRLDGYIAAVDQALRDATPPAPREDAAAPTP